MRQEIVTRVRIAAGLRRLGLRRGDKIIVHSSLSSFGHVEDGAYGIIDALMEVVGPGGTIVMPTFNHGRTRLFDVKESPSYNGRVTETFRHMPGVRRGSHPTHPYAVWGADADEWTSGSHLVNTWGPQTPLGRLIDAGGWVLLLGVTHWSSTAQHHGEVYSGIRCIGIDNAPARLVDDEGEPTAVTGPGWRDGKCPCTPDIHEARLRRIGAVRDAYVGSAHLQLMRASQTVKAVMQLLRGETGVDYCRDCPRVLRTYNEAIVQRIWASPRPPSKWDAR